jgi:hypothetical protein
MSHEEGDHAKSGAVEQRRALTIYSGEEEERERAQEKKMVPGPFGPSPPPNPPGPPFPRVGKGGRGRTESGERRARERAREGERGVELVDSCCSNYRRSIFS